jgi:signal transduction histidine kinase
MCPVRSRLPGIVADVGTLVLLLAVDLVALAVLSEVLDGRVAERNVLLAVLVLSAVGYAPLRRRLTALARRLARGDRDHPYGAVAGLAASLETAGDEDAQLTAVARSVAAAFGVSYVAVEVDRPDGERVVATRGTRPAEVRALPIRYRDETVGRLVLPARGLRTRLSRRDERLLGDLVRQAATFARTRRLAAELQHNRERLVVAREEERRRIRHDLHDELAPTLGGIVFGVDSALLLVDRDPDAARDRIAETTAHLTGVVAHVRRLVHDLRPPALDDLGLVGALRQHASTLSVPTEVVAELDDEHPLPAAVEVAGYRIAVGALDNVVRHASAGSAAVTLSGTGSALVVEVRDDGVGIPPEVEAGHGLTGLRERAAELGGHVEVTCPPEGGTRVRATIPVRAS